MKSTIKTICINYLFILFFLGGFVDKSNAQLINSTKNYINITNPTANTTWIKGQTVIIRWTSNISANANVRILLYRGNTLVAPITNITSNIGYYVYSVPNSLANASDYRIRIFDIANPSVRDFSDFFTITSNTPTIHITNPTASTIWTAGQNEIIQWTSNFPASANIRIFLYEGNNLVASVANSIPNTGSYTYSVPNSLINSSNYRLQIFDIANPASVVYSDFFTITNGSPTINITNPTANTVWNTGQNESIQWTSNFSASANMRIFLYKGNNLVAPVANFIPNTGSYTYSVPNSLVTSSNYRLQIFDIANPASVAYSDFFTINNNNGSKSSLIENKHFNQQTRIELFSIYPNPQLFGTTSQLSIQANEETSAQMFVFDITGKIVFQKTIKLIKGKNKIDTANSIEKGMYLVSIQTPSTTKSLKLLVK